MNGKNCETCQGIQCIFKQQEGAPPGQNLMELHAKEDTVYVTLRQLETRTRLLGDVY